MKGFVTAYLSSPNGRTEMFRRANLIVDQSGDANAACADKFSGVSMSYAYFEFGTELSVFDSPAPEDTSGSVAAAAIGGRDVLRCPLLVPPGYSSSDESRFASNALSFFASTATARPVGGSRKGFVSQTAFQDGAMIGGACLVASSGDRSSDLLVARLKFDSPIEKIADHEIDIQWVITFSPPS